MKFLKSILESEIEEGVSKDGDAWKFDFSMDSDDDILQLRLLPYRGKTMKMGDMTYRYFNAFDIYKSDSSGELMKSIKYLDSSIDPKDLDMLVSKGILAFNKEFKINTFDTIITPKSSSMILQKLSDRMYLKSGASNLFSDAFIKNANTDITYDKEKVEKLPDKTKKEFLRALDKEKGKDDSFKMRNIFQGIVHLLEIS